MKIGKIFAVAITMRLVLRFKGLRCARASGRDEMRRNMESINELRCRRRLIDDSGDIAFVPYLPGIEILL